MKGTDQNNEHESKAMTTNTKAKAKATSPATATATAVAESIDARIDAATGEGVAPTPAEEPAPVPSGTPDKAADASVLFPIFRGGNVPVTVEHLNSVLRNASALAGRRVASESRDKASSGGIARRYDWQGKAADYSKTEKALRQAFTAAVNLLDAMVELESLKRQAAR